MTRSTRTVRSTLIAALVAIATVVVTAPPAAAGATRPSAAPAANGADDGSDRTLVATGTARIRGVPDVLTSTLGVTTRADTVGSALDRNNQAVAKVIAVLENGDVDADDIQTSSLSISPVYGDRSDEITGYQVANLVTVRLRDLARAGALIDKVAAAGGDDVVMRGVSFGFDDTSALVARARTDAVKRARAQAEQLAEAAGVTLVEVRTISESSVDPGPVLAAPETAARADDGVPIAPGTEELSVQVSLVYTIR